jgi:replicative DNA helicase
MSDWEKSLIGTVLADAQSYDAAQDLLPSDFTGANQIIWAELMPLATRNALDARSLVNALRQSQDWDRVEQLTSGTEAYFAECFQMRGTQAAEYANQVLEASIKRGLKRNAALIAAEADGNQRSADERRGQNHCHAPHSH